MLEAAGKLSSRSASSARACERTSDGRGLPASVNSRERCEVVAQLPGCRSGRRSHRKGGVLAARVGLIGRGGRELAERASILAAALAASPAAAD